MVTSPIRNQEELDALVHKLVQQAIQHSAGTQQRTQAIESLLALAQQLPGILTQERLDTGLRLYYDEALKRTENSVRNTIDKFPGTYQLDLFNAEPAVVRKYFVRWYNQILKCDCIDLWRARKNRPQLVSLDESVGEEGETTREEITPDPTLEPITAAILAENQRILQELIIYKLDDIFTQLLQTWAAKTLLEREPEEKQLIALAIGDFSNLIAQFPLGSIASNLEIAITGYEIVLTVFNPQDSSELWATIQNNLGNAYLNRIRGDKAENLEIAIAAYSAALQVLTRDAFPQDWAMTQNNLGNAYTVTRLKL